MSKSKKILLGYLLVIILVITVTFVFSVMVYQHVAAKDDTNNWDVTISGMDKTIYVAGEVVSIKVDYHMCSPEPNRRQQLLMGLVDQTGKVIQVYCLFNHMSSENFLCPNAIGNVAPMQLSIPTTEGIYTILATNDFQDNCEEAQNNFPNQSQIKRIKQFSVVQNSAMLPANNSETQKLSEPSSNNLPTIFLFSANPSSIKKGESTRISWEVVNATQILITPEPGRAAPKAGYTTAQLSEPTTYTLTATNSYGSVIKEITVNIIGVSPASSSLNELPTLPTLPTRRIADTIDDIILRIKIWIQQLVHFVLTILLPVACIVIIGIIVWKNRGKIRQIISPRAENEGYIYIMYNPSYKKDYYKVGRSRNPERRAEELSAPTGVAGKFEVLFKLQVTDAVLTEKRVHKELEKYRPHDNKEFFELPIDIIIDTIRKNKN